jgi:purine nucleosidase
MTSRPIIIDTDPGQDDAIAMLLALGSPEVDVRAVTTVAGNVPQPRVTDNARAILALAGRSDVPVYRGCERPMLRNLYTAEYVHGPTGLDGATLPRPVVAAEPGHGVDLIVEGCLDADDEPLTICALGPLTNVGMAIAKEPRITERIREIVWMGGAIDEAGNTTPLAEFNAYVDPHAAHVVLTSGVPITMFPLDVTHRALMLPDHVEALAARGTAVADAAAGMIRYYERYDIDKYDIPGAPMHDPCVIAYLVDPSLFSGSMRHVAIDSANEPSVGNTFVVDDGRPNAMVMTDVDADAFFGLIIDRVGGL